MNRPLLSLGILAVVIQITGCGSSNPGPADLPEEVRIQEAKDAEREALLAKGIKPKIPKAVHTKPVISSAIREAGAR